MEAEIALQFPCQFPIKVIGKNQAHFDTVVVAIIRQHCAVIKPSAITTKLSKSDNYSSVTVSIEASSKKQLDAIYQALADCPDVLMTL